MGKIIVYKETKCQDEDIKSLRDRLLKIGGYGVEIDEEYFCCENVIDRGKSFIFEKKDNIEEDTIHVNHIEFPGYLYQAYLNSTYVWETSIDEVPNLRLIEGFALEKDEIWREHCWLAMIDFDKEDPGILKDIGELPCESGIILIETTGVLKSGYYGYFLEHDEAKELASQFVGTHEKEE